MRLAPGQDPGRSAPRWSGCCATRCPAGAELSFEAELAEPSRFDPAMPALQAGAQRDGARARDATPALVRSGGSLPILASFMERGIPAIVSGFALPPDNIHSPDESYRLASLERGRRAARALFEELAKLR